MLAATLLALGAAVLHAGWNLAAKAADGDRFAVLWAQFAIAGAIAMVALAAVAVLDPLPAAAYGWGALSGLVHLGYLILLARSYDVGDLSVAYPIARGGGAALAGLGGVVFLGDRLRAAEVAGIAIVVAGIALIALRKSANGVGLAALLALCVGTYTVIDSRGARITDGVGYVLVVFAATPLTTTPYGLLTGRGAAMLTMARVHWRRAAATAVAALVTYGMVLAAVRRAPVGYVTALRESSVVIAAVVGWRVLGEGDARRRVLAALVVLAGLVTLVVARV